MRYSFFLLCLLMMPPVHAAWTGIGAFIIQGESDWAFNGDVLEADFVQYGLRIEEKTEVELRVGASAGQFSVRLLDINGTMPPAKYDGQFLSFYLRWPHQLTDSIRLHSLLNYQFNLGEQRENDEDEIEWTEVSVNFGISLQLGRLSLRPFIDLRHVDGDISGTTSATRLFDMDDQQSSGLQMDYFVERDAFVRLRFTNGGYRTFMLSFAREF